ncbi:cell wall protein DAN4-like [Cryptotermes secundus]|uniref:cell wall protein DAN4-like n=1 Tax=Cryptotermes secundus TaxID=105785 RepID=UPI000CD7BCF7|nr:cell wall protein DAN4-like [Cryptotermes secundus]
MNLSAAITLLILKIGIFVAGQNVTITNTTTTIITTVITTNNTSSNATVPTTSTTTPTTTSSRMTTLPSVTTWGPLMYCWFPCFGGSCGGGYPLPQRPPSGGTLSWWFGFQFQWSRSKSKQQRYPCPKKGSRNQRRRGC